MFHPEFAGVVDQDIDPAQLCELRVDHLLGVMLASTAHSGRGVPHIRNRI